MRISMKIHVINPSNSMGLENRLAAGKQKPSGKAYLHKINVTFDEYLEAQLKGRDFASHFKKAGHSGAVVLKKSSPAVVEPSFALTLNDIIPELHIPFHAFRVSDGMT
jgi:hypothetical protein